MGIASAKTGKGALVITADACLDVSNIAEGVFSPLAGFLAEMDYRSVVEHMHLESGAPWTLPITLEVPEEQVAEVAKRSEIELRDTQGGRVATMEVEEVFRVDQERDILRIFGTSDASHPGVAAELGKSEFRVGGPVKRIEQSRPIIAEHAHPPSVVKEMIRAAGWKTVAGFQTRNPVHRAHEYLHRLAMELTEGVFLQPIVGWKKSGDIAPDGVVGTYELMVDEFYPRGKVLLGTLSTAMWYAGPREAVFHAIIRRNFGCTHFIVGRDHAGVSDYYGKYEAQDLVREFTDLGIEILCCCGPYYCPSCGGVVTEKTCGHGEKVSLSVSGTKVRSLLSRGERPQAEVMRPEVSDLLLDLYRDGRLFVP